MQYFIIFILFMLCLPLCAQESISRQERLSKIDSIFNAYYQPDKPGGAMAIIENGQTTYSNHIGLANIEHRVQITDSTAFHIASVSKQFTAFLALLLEQEGKLSLTRDIRDYSISTRFVLGEVPLQFLKVVGIASYGINKVTLYLGKGFEACRSSDLGFAIEPNVFNGILLRGISSQTNQGKRPLLLGQLPVDFLQVVLH